MSNKAFKQFVMVEFHNCPPYLETMISDTEITLQRIVAYLESKDGFDPDEDSVTCVDQLTEVDIDDLEVDDDPDESMDGDFDSGMASAGFGTEEDYGPCGGDEEF